MGISVLSFYLFLTDIWSLWYNLSRVQKQLFLCHWLPHIFFFFLWRIPEGERPHFRLSLNSDSSVIGVGLVLDPTQAILSAASFQHSVKVKVCLQNCLCLTQNKVSVFTLNTAIHQRWRPENLYPHHTECLSLSTNKDTKLSWDLEAITLRKLKAVQDIVWSFHVHL